MIGNGMGRVRPGRLLTVRIVRVLAIGRRTLTVSQGIVTNGVGWLVYKDPDHGGDSCTISFGGQESLCTDGPRYVDDEER